MYLLILHEYNTVDKYNTFVKNEGWVNAETFSPFFAMRELQGKTIGLSVMDQSEEKLPT